MCHAGDELDKDVRQQRRDVERDDTHDEKMLAARGQGAGTGAAPRRDAAILHVVAVVVVVVAVVVVAAIMAVVIRPCCVRGRVVSLAAEQRG